MHDKYGRTINYMRISITDRCNLRCRYCMPDGIELIPMARILSYEEITEICRAAAELGISRLKITGGEPLARLGAPDLIAMLKQIPGIEQVTMTTNGVLLGRYLPELLAAGLDAVNISLDTLIPGRFSAITGRDELHRVLESMDAALEAGLPVKVNAVLQPDMNEDEWLSLAEMARDRRLDVRFIEMMPIGMGRRFSAVSNRELLERIRQAYPQLETDHSVHGNGPAVYYRIPGWKGSIGFISAMHGRFCGSCNRIRLTAQGKLKPCLCFGDTVDLMPLLRTEHDREAGTERAEAERSDNLKSALRTAILGKPLQHCFEMEEDITERSRLASIGG